MTNKVTGVIHRLENTDLNYGFSVQDILLGSHISVIDFMSSQINERAFNCSKVGLTVSVSCMNTVIVGYWTTVAIVLVIGFSLWLQKLNSIELDFR